MTIADMIRKALATSDAELAEVAQNALRFGCIKAGGVPVLFSHQDVLDAVARVTGRELPDVGIEWDQLLARSY